MTCAISGSAVPGPVTCWGALANNYNSTAYEVACTTWGCAASAYFDGIGGVIGCRVEIVTAVGGPPAPLQAGVNVGAAAIVTTLAGFYYRGAADGLGTMAQFNNPRSVSLDGAGGLYVADSGNYAIRRVDTVTRIVTTVAGVAGFNGRDVGATPLESKFNMPFGVEADGTGNVYVADYGNQAIRMLSGVWVAGSTTGSVGSSDNDAGTSATFNYPFALRADVAGGMLYVADNSNARVRVISTSGNHSVTTLASSIKAFDIALNTARQVVYVAGANIINVVSYAGVVTFLAGGGTSGEDSVGSAAGFGSGNYRDILGMALDSLVGVLYASDTYNSSIRCITIAGVVTTVAGRSSGLVDGAGTNAKFNLPWGVALDAASNSLYVSDSMNQAIRLVKVSPPAVGSIYLMSAPLPPSPVLPTHQLASWRGLGISSRLIPPPLLDAHTATFSAPLTPANTAGMNPAIVSLWLGSVSLAPRDPGLAASGNTNTTFSTSAQRGLRWLNLAALAVPAYSLALPFLTSLTVAAVETQQRQVGCRQLWRVGNTGMH